MTNYSAAAGDRGVYKKQLTAATVDQVTFPKETPVDVWSDGTADVWFTVDGTTPTVGGQNCWWIPAGSAAVRENVPFAQVAETVGYDGQGAGTGAPTPGSTVVKLISSGTPFYSVNASI